MKYITEYDIRHVTKKEDKYFLKSGEYLTPSAKEYLNDKRIKLIREEKEGFTQSEGTGNEQEKLYIKKNIVKSLFLEKISEIMQWDYNLSQELLEVYEEFLLVENKKIEKIAEEEIEMIDINQRHLKLRTSKIVMKLNNIIMNLFDYRECLKNKGSINLIIIKIIKLIKTILGELQ